MHGSTAGDAFAPDSALSESSITSEISNRCTGSGAFLFAPRVFSNPVHSGCVSRDTHRRRTGLRHGHLPYHGLTTGLALQHKAAKPGSSSFYGPAEYLPHRARAAC